MKPPGRVRKIVYFGSPPIAVPPLEALCSAGYRITLVVTRPPSRRSRRGKPAHTPVASAAHGLGLPVVTRLDDKAVRKAVSQADLGVIVAYGELIDTDLLNECAMVNIHFSLLPRWRGAAPVERAILAGDAETGVSLMEVVDEIDAGAVYQQEATPIAANETAAELRARLCDLGVTMLIQTLGARLRNPVAQSGVVTYADKIEPSDLRIDWSLSAERIHRVVRVGGAWTTFRGRRLKIIEADWDRLARDSDSSSSLDKDRESANGDVSGGGRVPGVGVSGGRGPGVGVSERGRVPGVGVSGGRVPGVVSEGQVSEGDCAREDGLIPGTIRVSGKEVVVDTCDGVLKLRIVQAEGRAAVDARAWRNGARITAGERFDQ